MSNVNRASDPKLTEHLRSRLQGRSTVRYTGRVVHAVGTSLRVSGLPVRIGQRCEVHDRVTDTVVLADVVGIDKGDAVLVPLGGIQGVAVDSTVRIVSERVTVPVGEALFGRVVDGFGQPLDQLGAITNCKQVPLSASAPNPLQRQRVRQRLTTGVKSIDTLLTVGVGQRLGIFAPAGVGKSTLLGMLAMHSEADVIVVGLIGERGREVREFLEDALSQQARERAVFVVATSDRPAMERVNAATTATAIAEGFRDEGQKVLLLMDSVTRYARAVREVGLAIGEPPVRQGFTPSVFAELPRLFERTGNNQEGSITAFYTVLTDDDDGLDPIAEETRSILDGHIVLSRSIAEQNHFPAIDVLASLSRLSRQLTSVAEQEVAGHLRSLMSKYRDIEFLLQVGEYKAGSDALADEAIAKHATIQAFLQQQPNEGIGYEESTVQLMAAMGMNQAAVVSKGTTT
ncbi:MAG: FliI/YscN family ATPase [Granulosicoccus sp.]